MKTQSNLHLVATYKASSRLASAIVAAIGCAVLVGWMLDIAVLKSVFPGLATMKANTAIGFILSGLSLWLLHTESTAPRTRRIAQACAVIVSHRGNRPAQFLALGAALVALLALVGYVYGATTFYGLASYTQLALHTAAAFFVLGLAILFARPVFAAHHRGAHRRQPSH